MTTGIEFLKPSKKRVGRGLGKKPALLLINIRVPFEVVEYFNTHYPLTKQVQMRQVLIDYVIENNRHWSTTDT
jgi:hypothetical protein